MNRHSDGRPAQLAGTTNFPSSHPVCRRPTHRGAGAVPGVQVERAAVRTTWTPGAVSARLCLGRRQTGWELPRISHTRPALARGAPAISEPERPRRRHVLHRSPGPISSWARVGAACAERAEGRSAARSGAGSAPGGAERSRGLMNVGKLLPRWTDQYCPVPVDA
jgi:hypothetical protein